MSLSSFGDGYYEHTVSGNDWFFFGIYRVRHLESSEEGGVTNIIIYVGFFAGGLDLELDTVVLNIYILIHIS